MGSVAVIGAGIAGLAAAHRLLTAGVDVTVYEGADRVGGVVHTVHDSGFLVEDGPNTITAPAPLLRQLLSDLHLLDRMIPAAAVARRRYVIRHGRPVSLPSGPLDLLTTALLSPRGRLRLLAEPFAAAPPASDESVADFARRRLGSEAAAYLVDPFVAGIFAARADQLSVRYALPRIAAMEREHGSLFRGALAAAKKRTSGSPRRPTIWSLPEGLGELPAALAAPLSGRIEFGAPVLAAARSGDAWELRVDGREAPARHAAIIWAAPAHRLVAALPIDHRSAEALTGLFYAPVAVVALGFRRADVGHPLDGFGMLAPSAEGRRILGTLFSSSLFPGRAPDGMVLLTTFVGGARSPELAADPPEVQLPRVLGELRALLSIRGEPVYHRLVQWPAAIPQYRPGHAAVNAAIDEFERLPGVALAGSYRAGVSVGDTIASGLAAAERIMARPPG